MSSLKDSQIIVINGNINKVFEKKIRSISKDINIYYSQYLPINIDRFKNQSLLAFAGIGNPSNFFNLLEKNNLSVAKKISFPDHYSYSVKELNELVDISIRNNLKIITTEKDYFRIEQHKIPQIEYLSVELEIDNKDKFYREVIKCLS